MFKGTLTKHQLEAAEFLCVKKKAGLFFEQGTGKTVIALAAAEELRELGYIKKILVVCPTHITWQWQERIEEFTDAYSKVATAKTQSSRSYEINEGYQVVPYSLLRKDYNQIARQDWCLVIADEAQEIKNNRSKTSKLFKRYLAKVPYKWALTGTAISNKLEELYNILYWIDKDFLPKWPAFERKHITRDYFGGIKGYKNLELLAEQLPRRVSRKTQADLGGLPKIIPQSYYFEKTPKLKEAEASLLDILSTLNPDTQTRDPRLSSALHACRRESITSDKIDFAVNLTEDLIQENKDNKVVIFSFYKEPIYELEAFFGMRGIPTVTYTGDQNSEEKHKAIKEFQGDAKALLCSNAASTGVDLPFANHLFHLDVPFDFGTLDQRSKRIVRFSSKFVSCVVHNFLIRYSLEEFYYKILKNKGLLADATFKGDRGEVTVRPDTLRSYLDRVA